MEKNRLLGVTFERRLVTNRLVPQSVARQACHIVPLSYLAQNLERACLLGLGIVD